MSGINGISNNGYNAGMELWRESINNNAQQKEAIPGANNNESDPGKIADKNNGECKTCENRTYQDESNDSGVSFQTPTKVGKAGAEAAVRGHELEHVMRNNAKAQADGGKVEYSSVAISYAICSECGASYVSGGLTTTVTSKPVEQPSRPEGIEQVDTKI